MAKTAEFDLDMPASHVRSTATLYCAAAQEDRQVHVEHVAYFQSREAF